LLEITTAVTQSEELLRKIKHNLPDLIDLSAFPTNAYSLFRSYHTIPRPPNSESGSFRLSIICHVDDSTVQAMEYQIRSALRQSSPFSSFYAIGTAPSLKQVVDRAAAADRRFFWVSSHDPLADEQRIARQEDCDAVLLLPAGAELHQETAAWIRHAFELYDAPAWITDEETLLQLEAKPARLLPVLRRLVDRETLRECNPYGEGIAIRRSKLIATSTGPHSDLATARHSLLLSLTSAASVGHIPLPLIQKRLQAEVKSSHSIRRSAIPATERRERIHVIIPTRDNLSDVENLINSMKNTATRPEDISCHIVNNGTTKPADLERLAEITRAPNNYRLDVDEPFNWSRLNNLAAATLQSGILVFANDDMVMKSPDWDGEISRLFLRPDVGIVGGKLLYPDETIQHAGVLFGWKGSTIHEGIYESGDAEGPARRWMTTRAVSAIDGAFLATPSALFHEVGGFDELYLPVCHSDVDYALRLRSRGLRVLWTPHVVLILSNGAEVGPRIGVE
jgi:GT2 family glycosyltransferase